MAHLLNSLTKLRDNFAYYVCNLPVSMRHIHRQKDKTDICDVTDGLPAIHRTHTHTRI